MKDEERADKHAEEYVMREDVITENDRVPFDNGYGFQTVSFEEEVKKGFKDGFLAGLKAGRPQWHDLRKDKNDLPKEGTKVISEKGDFVFLQDKHWKEFSPNWDNIPLRKWEEPIAWCEKPTFDKE